MRCITRRVEQSFVHARPRQLDHFVDTRRGDRRASSKAGDLFFALHVSRIADRLGAVFKFGVGQTLQHFGVGTVINHTVKRPAMGVKTAPDARHADARALHAGIDQRLRHALTPRVFNWTKLRNPAIAIFLTVSEIGNDDRLASIGGQDHRGII